WSRRPCRRPRACRSGPMSESPGGPRMRLLLPFPECGCTICTQGQQQGQEQPMKPLTVSALAIASIIGLGALAAQAQSDRPLTVVSWGGAYQEAQKEVYFEPFKAAAGIEMIDESWDGGIGVLRSKVEGAADSGWDVIQVESEELTIGCDE